MTVSKAAFVSAANTPDDLNAPATVRAAGADDVVQIHALAVDNGMFPNDEMAGFDQMFQGYLDGSLDQHRWVVADNPAGGVVGAAYYAPEPFADRLWNLYFLAVHPGEHRKGIGTLLISHVEKSLRKAGSQVARVLIVETSSADGYQSARNFYERKDFHFEARVREFYGPGDHKIVYWKSLVKTGA